MTAQDSTSDELHHGEAKVDDVELEEEDKAMKVLKSSMEGGGRGVELPIIIQQRQTYENRLLTFKATTFYAKPACLSPLICARFGWRNAETDMLSCASCKAALAIKIPSGLSPKITESLCHKYRKCLVDAHDKDCSFRLDGLSFLKSEEEEAVEDNRNGRKSIIPSHMVSVLPPDFVNLMEHPFPSSLLRQRIRLLDQQNPSPECKYQHLEVSPEIFKFHLGTNTNYFDEEHDDKSNDRNGITLIKDISGFLGAKEVESCALAILGWTLLPQNNQGDVEPNAPPQVTLGCPVCLSTMELTFIKKTSSSGAKSSKEKGHRAAKRRKTLARFGNPHDAHRHYCPYRCGFPRSMRTVTPAWQLLLSRLYQEKSKQKNSSKTTVPTTTTEEEPPQGVVKDSDEAFDKIRKILRSALAPKKVDLTVDESEL